MEELRLDGNVSAGILREDFFEVTMAEYACGNAVGPIGSGKRWSTR
jgi:hypothetical protein